MEDFLGIGWGILTQLYTAIYQAGYPGCLIAFVIGVVLNKKGLRITGRAESYSGSTSYGGQIDVRKNDAIHGSATTKVDHLFGVLLKIAGIILVFTAIIAVVNLTL